jgi:hypothetical protein
MKHFITHPIIRALFRSNDLNKMPEIVSFLIISYKLEFDPVSIAGGQGLVELVVANNHPVKSD